MQLCGFPAGLNHPIFLIAGPCAIESEALAMDTATVLKAMAERLGIPLIYKSSFDKANRSSASSFRGPGIAAGLRILAKVRSEVGVPVITDVHEDTPMDEVADVVDVLQTPAFLCRQTNFIERVARAGLPVNIKKGQFLAPSDMQHVVGKAIGVGNRDVLVCERGASFGYNNLVSDMRALAIMRATDCPVVFDATHSVQLPGGQGASSGGQREFVPGACSGRRGRRRCRAVHGDASGSGQCAERRAERLAAAGTRGTVDYTHGHRPYRQGRTVRRDTVSRAGRALNAAARADPTSNPTTAGTDGRQR